MGHRKPGAVAKVTRDFSLDKPSAITNGPAMRVKGKCGRDPPNLRLTVPLIEANLWDDERSMPPPWYFSGFPQHENHER